MDPKKNHIKLKSFSYTKTQPGSVSNWAVQNEKWLISFVYKTMRPAAGSSYVLNLWVIIAALIRPIIPYQTVSESNSLYYKAINQKKKTITEKQHDIFTTTTVYNIKPCVSTEFYLQCFP